MIIAKLIIIISQVKDFHVIIVIKLFNPQCMSIWFERARTKQVLLMRVSVFVCVYKINPFAAQQV